MAKTTTFGQLRAGDIFVPAEGSSECRKRDESSYHPVATENLGNPLPQYDVTPRTVVVTR